MFVLVRHGNTFAATEKPRRIGARTDLPLTEQGREQAHALGAYFARQGLVFKKALVSPLMRTRQTAEAILGHQPAPVAMENPDFLREIDHGPDEDREEDAVLARIGAGALRAWDAHAHAPPGWLVDADARIGAWQSLFAAPPPADAPVLIVTSNGAARFALLADPELQRQAGSLRRMKLPTRGHGVIERNGARGLRIGQWGKRP